MHFQKLRHADVMLNQYTHVMHMLPPGVTMDLDFRRKAQLSKQCWRPQNEPQFLMMIERSALKYMTTFAILVRQVTYEMISKKGSR